MKFKNIHLILNPAAGTADPILAQINTAFSETDISWDVSVTKKSGDAYTIAKEHIGNSDLVVVYGGDGSISEAAAALFNSATPMAIVPGGTANVTAKELGIPMDIIPALQLITSDKSKIMAIDIGLANDEPFIIRINLGIMADMIIQADRKLKDSLGQLAYGITAVKEVIKSEPVDYKLIIDGVPFTESGVSLTVTNVGSLGIGTFGLLPGISVTDGLLDVIILNDTDVMSLLKVAGSTLFQNESEVLKHWKCKEVIINTDKPFSYICDDVEKRSSQLHIKIVPAALNVLVP